MEAFDAKAVTGGDDEDVSTFAPVKAHLKNLSQSAQNFNKVKLMFVGKVSPSVNEPSRLWQPLLGEGNVGKTTLLSCFNPPKQKLKQIQEKEKKHNTDNEPKKEKPPKPKKKKKNIATVCASVASNASLLCHAAF